MEALGPKSAAALAALDACIRCFDAAALRFAALAAGSGLAGDEAVAEVRDLGARLGEQARALKRLLAAAAAAWAARRERLPHALRAKQVELVQSQKRLQGALERLEGAAR